MQVVNKRKKNKYRTVDIGAWLKILHSLKYINYNNDNDPIFISTVPYFSFSNFSSVPF